MLTDQDKADLRKLDATTKSTAITQQIQRIHVAVNDGTLDRAAVNDALERLTELTGVDKKDEKKPDSFAAFTGQKPPETPHPVAPVQPQA